MAVKYSKPMWLGKGINYSAITDAQIEEYETETKRHVEGNAKLYLSKQEQRAELLSQAVDLFGANTNVVNAIKSTSIPKPPDFSGEWKKLTAAVNKARQRVKDEQTRQLRKAEERERRQQRAAEQRQIAAERDAYVEGLPQSD